MKPRPLTFTMARLRALPPAPAGRRVNHHDALTPHLILRVTDKGGKTFNWVGRINGRPTRLHLGAFPALTVDGARAKAAEMEARVLRGEDPSGERKARREAPTLGDLWKEYRQKHVLAHLRPRTQAEYEALWERHLAPWRNRRLASIRRADVQALHAAIGKKSGQTTANRALAVLKAMLNEARRAEMMGDNPAAGIRMYRENRRERFLSGEELARLGEALAHFDRARLTASANTAVFRLLVLSGCRLGEAVSLRWEHVDLERAMLHLPESKTGRKPIYLSAVALQMLTDMRPEPAAGWVFPGRKEGEPVTVAGVEHAWKRVRKHARLEDVRLHDLRHAFASVGAGAGLGLPLLGALLGHSQPATTARYAHLAADPLRQAADLVGGRIAEAMGFAPEPVHPAAVVPLDSRRRAT